MTLQNSTASKGIVAASFATPAAILQLIQLFEGSDSTTPNAITLGLVVLGAILTYLVPNAKTYAEQGQAVFTEVHHHHYLGAAEAVVHAVGADVPDVEKAVDEVTDWYAKGQADAAAYIAKATTTPVDELQKMVDGQ